MARYRLTSQAITDVDEIWLYIARDNLTAADRLIDRFTEVYEHLSAHPGMGQAQDKYREGLRSFSVGNYLIFYRSIADGIEVYRMLHGSRNLEDLLSRD